MAKMGAGISRISTGKGKGIPAFKKGKAPQGARRTKVSPKVPFGKGKLPSVGQRSIGES